jgi:hypothetical protein
MEEEIAKIVKSSTVAVINIIENSFKEQGGFKESRQKDADYTYRIIVCIFSNVLLSLSTNYSNLENVIKDRENTEGVVYKMLHEIFKTIEYAIESNYKNTSGFSWEELIKQD